MKERRGRHPSEFVDDTTAQRLANQLAGVQGARLPEGGRVQGTVIRRVPARYFGFLRVEGQRDEYFYHADDLENCDFSGLVEGDRATFTIKPDSKKGPRAIEVRRV